jgi:hypothetical protein
VKNVWWLVTGVWFWRRFATFFQALRAPLIAGGIKPRLLL